MLYDEIDLTELAKSILKEVCGGSLPTIDGSTDANTLRKIRRSFNRAAEKAILRIRDNTSETDAKRLERAFDSIKLGMDWFDDTLEAMGHRGRISDLDESDVVVPNRDSKASAVDYGWRDKEGRAVAVLRPDQRFADHIPRGESRQAEGLGFGQFLRALAIGPQNEAEKRALAEGTPSAGGYTVPAPLAAAFIDRLRAQSVVFQAGARTVPMQANTLQIARLDTDPTFSFRAENAQMSDNSPTFGAVTFTAASCVSLVRASRELLADSVNVNEALLDAFGQAAALVVDRVALDGSGSSDEPEGILNITGINELTTIGSPTYDDWIDALYELELDNVPAPYASVSHPRTLRTLRKLKTNDAGYLVPPPEVAAMQRFTSTQLPPADPGASPPETSESVVGHFPHLLIGMRSELMVEVLKERYADYFQYAFLAHLRFDVQLAHKASFCAVRGITE